MTKLRTCVACKAKRMKDEMIRVVRYKGEYELDLGKKAMGRGAYVCPECTAKAVKTHALNRSYKAQVPNEIYERLPKETNGQ